MASDTQLCLRFLLRRRRARLSSSPLAADSTARPRSSHGLRCHGARRGVSEDGRGRDLSVLRRLRLLGGAEVVEAGGLEQELRLNVAGVRLRAQGNGRHASVFYLCSAKGLLFSFGFGLNSIGTKKHDTCIPEIFLFLSISYPMNQRGP
jgi:hypothetical protein